MCFCNNISKFGLSFIHASELCKATGNYKTLFEDNNHCKWGSTYVNFG